MPTEPKDHALGRSRGGLSTQIHLRCDGDGRPLHFPLTPGQDHEAPAWIPLWEGADAAITDGQGQPVAWPAALAGDKGYRAGGIEDTRNDLEIRPVIPSKTHEDRDTRPVTFDREAYRDRNLVERLIGWLKERRRIRTRCEKTALNYAGMIKLAFIHRDFRILEL